MIQTAPHVLRIDVLLPRMCRAISSIRDQPQLILHSEFPVERVVENFAPVPPHDTRKIIQVNRILHTSTLSQVLCEFIRTLIRQRFAYSVFHPPPGNTLHVSHDERPHRIPKDVQCAIQRVPIRSLPRRTHRLNTSNEYSAPAASFPRRQESSLHTTHPLHGLHTSHPRTSFRPAPSALRNPSYPAQAELATAELPHQANPPLDNSHPQYTTHVFPHSAHPSYPHPPVSFPHPLASFPHPPVSFPHPPTSFPPPLASFPPTHVIPAKAGI